MKKLFGLLALLAALGGTARGQKQNFPSGTGGGITWTTVAALDPNNVTSGVTDGNGSSCTVGGGTTKVICHWNGASWDVIDADPIAIAALTGAVKTATNGGPPNYLVPGLNPSPDVSSTPYTIRCDTSGGGATTLDRAQTVRFVAGASVATMPDIGTAGCTAGFVTSLIAGVTETVNRTTASTFDIYNGTNPPLTGQTTFSLPAGQHATISPSASGTSWIVRFASAVTGASVTSTTPVTVTNPTINTDTQMIELALPAGFLNKAGMGYTIRAGGLYSNTVATSPALTFNAKLCTVSGCGSGTVVGLAQIVSGATSATATTNDTWTYSLYAVNNATGATGNLLVKGDPGLTIDLSNVTAAADTIYADVNTAVSGNIDLTAALFLDFTVAQSVAGASNSYKQLSAMIAPHPSPAGTGGTSCAALLLAPCTVASVDLTAQAGGTNIGNTTFYTTPASGSTKYRMSVFAVITQAATTSSTLGNVGGVFTDVDTNANIAIPQLGGVNSANLVGTMPNCVLNNSCIFFFDAKPSTAIQYNYLNGASSGATPMQFALHIKLENIP